MGAKRASMREGPLAALFRSTEESVPDEEIKVTATKRTDPAERNGNRSPANGDASQALSPVSKPAGDDRPASRGSVVAEPKRSVDPEPAPVVDEPNDPIGHPGLEQLLGGDVEAFDARPVYGREEPDLVRTPAIPRRHEAVLRVVGVGGAGVNAVNRMVDAGIPGVEFVAINTDLQSLKHSRADRTLHIGGTLTRGLGSGSDPQVGYRSAFDDQDKIKNLLRGSDMVFVAAGAGGGTGTGAAPVVAKLARDAGALTVATVTKPFAFEGAHRAAQAEAGVAALRAEVDTLIVIPNERLLKILERRTSIQSAFSVADDVLRQAVQGISDLVMLPGLINLDFADVRTTMLDAGDAILGIGMGVGEHRAVLAAEKAVSSPLLDVSVDGAQSLLLSITGGPDLTLIEASEAASIVQEAAHPDANIIFGACIDEELAQQVWVTVIATRFGSSPVARLRADRRELAPRTRDPAEPRAARAYDDEIASRFEQDWFQEDRNGSPPPLRVKKLAPRHSPSRAPRAPGDRTALRTEIPEFIPSD